jgi:hypothetical protein
MTMFELVTVGRLTIGNCKFDSGDFKIDHHQTVAKSVDCQSSIHAHLARVPPVRRDQPLKRQE